MRKFDSSSHTAVAQPSVVRLKHHSFLFDRCYLTMGSVGSSPANYIPEEVGLPVSTISMPT